VAAERLIRIGQRNVRVYPAADHKTAHADDIGGRGSIRDENILGGNSRFPT
jgi:hypothetical protein